MFKRRDWNIVAVTFEGPERLRLNGNREKGKRALDAKKGAANHSRTICWVVFDQEGKRLEGGLGMSADRLPPNQAERMLMSLPTNRIVLELVRELEQGRERVARPFTWEDREQDQHSMGF